LSDFHLHDFEFHPKEIQTPEVFSFFEELEFYSLLENKVTENQKWNHLNKKVNII